MHGAAGAARTRFGERGECDFRAAGAGHDQAEQKTPRRRPPCWLQWQSLTLPGANIMSINVSLPPELESRVRRHVESGVYGSASEVIREALRLFEAYQSVRQANLLALKADLGKGLADVAAGRVRPVNVESIKKRGREVAGKQKS